MGDGGLWCSQSLALKEMSWGLVMAVFPPFPEEILESLLPTLRILIF